MSRRRYTPSYCELVAFDRFAPIELSLEVSGVISFLEYEPGRIRSKPLSCKSNLSARWSRSVATLHIMWSWICSSRTSRSSSSKFGRSRFRGVLDWGRITTCRDRNVSFLNLSVCRPREPVFTRPSPLSIAHDRQGSPRWCGVRVWHGHRDGVGVQDASGWPYWGCPPIDDAYPYCIGNAGWYAVGPYDNHLRVRALLAMARDA